MCKKEYPLAKDCTRCQDEHGRKCILEPNARTCWSYEDEPQHDAVIVPKWMREADMF